MRARLLTSLAIAVLVSSRLPAAAASTPPPIAPTPVAIPAAAADPLALQLQQAAAEKARIEAVKASLVGTVDAATTQERALTDLVSANQRSIADTLARLGAAEQAVHDARAREATAHASAAAARTREQKDRRLLAQAIRMRYLEQDGLVGYVLSSQTMSDLFSRAATMSQVADRSRQLLGGLRDDVAVAETEEGAARAAAQDATAATVILAQQQQDLATQTAHAGELISQLGTQSRAATAEIARSDAQDAALAQRIADLRIQELDRTIAAAQEADWNAANYYLVNHLGALPPLPTPGLSTGLGGAAGTMQWPAPGAVMSQPFGPSPYPFEPAYAGFPHFHTGLDLAAPMDTPVLAAADGVVVSATPGASGYGNHIILGHSATLLTLYGHLEAMLVHPGDVVRRGQPIGLMGSTGNSTGPHLHFEVRVNNVPTDPAVLVSPPA